MSSKESYSADEWAAIMRAPGMAGAYIMLASKSGPLQVIKEATAIGQTLADTEKAGGGGPLITAILADMKAGARPAAMDMQHDKIKDDAQARQMVLDECRNAVNIIRQKAGEDEARSFASWLLTVAHKVAEAGKEGGFLGFGGVTVNEQETAALQELGQALGVPA